jgi:hypothetical protein
VIRSVRSSLAVFLAVYTMTMAGCRSPEDAARARFRERLHASTPLTHAEISQLVAGTLEAVGGRPVRVREGTTVRTLDARGRAEILAVLSGNVPTSDAGLRKTGGVVLRGIEGPATPPRSELDAAQTLWIDVDTLLPDRFELTYSMPGFGDYAHDLVW